ncbi:polyphosphate polymerase domain-containing protein [Demequina mangrovi]|uniref:VTC domain-containing protein n=1 Tax=Demequina mangrovi TaxID=1043493 RepID=A0A1H6VX51_9MICO|nr:polyphosphate polymerase domain-containing protein [Demequina mangrovi]SEJ09219.1 VTC domain-containing protein [Demequina mangrovi]
MTAWEERLAQLPTVTLAELETEYALLTRVDRKYIVSPDVWAEVMAEVPGMRALEIDGARSFGYASVYFDTPELDSYRDAARRRPLRYKVRTREYLDTGGRAIEVKLRSAKGETVKHREWLADDAAGESRLEGSARDFVASFPEVGAAVDELAPVLTTRYERSTLVSHGARVTVDSDVTGISAEGPSIGFGGALIVETKSSMRAGDVDRALWARGIRPARVSKYCTTLAALQPELPSNRWARTLRRHLYPAALAA